MLEKLLTKNRQVAAVVCNQFGDSGKGKVVHALAPWADVIARGTGGNNAGHTIILNGKERINHLLPIGIVYDSLGKINILGNGMVLDLKVLNQELDELDAENMTYNGLRISEDAHVIMPYHIFRDQKRNQSQNNGGIGSTGRGIGPCYTDKTRRTGIMVRDLFNVDKLYTKIEKALQNYSGQEIDTEEVMETLNPLADRIKPFVCDTIGLMHDVIRRGKKVLLEGAQGLFLSLDHGIYPYVTSSDPSVNGTAAGVGLNAGYVDLPLGLVKFPFMTRVGGGPFPSELGGEQGKLFCQDESRKLENQLKAYGVPYSVKNGNVTYDHHAPEILDLMNSTDPLQKAAGIRLAAVEFGATTRRPRRIGWTDTVLGKYAVNINGPNMILTKVDCLAGMDFFHLTIGHGKKQKYDRTVDVSSHMNVRMYKGFGSLEGIKYSSDLPPELKNSINDFEQFTGGQVVALSTGPGKDDVVYRGGIL
jgi:adenylosuccinate synthase